MTGLEFVYTGIDIVNDQSESGPKIKKSAQTKLMGAGAEVDSLLFVNLVVAIEEVVFDEKGEVITLVTEETITSDANPFDNVLALGLYIDELLKQKDA